MIKKIVQPPYLKAGDKVALISPAYWVPQEAILKAAETIKAWGLQPVIGPHTNNLNVNAYAGTADERADDLTWALEDDSIKAIICSRGGYGSIHLLNRVTLDTFRQVSTEKAVLTFKGQGTMESYQLEQTNPQLVKENRI